MQCLIVTAHPIENSLCKHLAEYIVNKLQETSHKIYVEDLYAVKFEPALTGAERESYYSSSYDSSAVSEQAERLLEAEGLVLVFPTWWFGFPAVLKRWFDRVWGPGIAYDHAADYGPIMPRLDKLRKVLVITSLGAPLWVDRLLMRQPLKRIVKTALLGACAKNSSLKYLSLYNSEKLDQKSIADFKHKIDKALSDWE